MILMCSDLCMHPEKIILAYSYRFKIEVSFKMLKQVIGGFCYHFWTTAMPKLSRFKTSDDLSDITEKKDKEKIISTMRAIEVFTFLSCMAMGILTTISLQFPTKFLLLKLSVQYCSKNCGRILAISVNMRLYQVF